MNILYENIGIRGERDFKIVKSMVDSGSERSLISPSLARQIGAKPLGTFSTFMLSDGRTVTGENVEVVIVIDRCEVPMVVSVFDGLPEDLVVGADFLRMTDAVVEFADEHMTFTCPEGLERID